MAPYVYQTFPRHLHRADGTFVIVTDEAQKREQLAAEWYLTVDEAKAAAAVEAAEELEELPTSDADPTEPSDAPRKRGRPRKA